MRVVIRQDWKRFFLLLEEWFVESRTEFNQCRGLAIAGKIGYAYGRRGRRQIYGAARSERFEDGEDWPSSIGITVHVVPEQLARPVPEAAELTPVTVGSFLVLAALVLLVACVSVANISLCARRYANARWPSVRLWALGRGRLVRQLLTEKVLLAFPGGVAGLILGNWTSGVISSIGLETNWYWTSVLTGES